MTIMQEGEEFASALEKVADLEIGHHKMVSLSLAMIIRLLVFIAYKTNQL